LNIPEPIVWLGKFIAGLRFEIDWEALDYLSRADELVTPILLFHGDADTIVPVETSDVLANVRPDIVTYHRVPYATHVRSWNMNPAAYETAVIDFMQEKGDAPNRALSIEHGAKSTALEHPRIVFRHSSVLIM
jgi:pimeloyl-ACP methyl ester carboxylesterase